MKKEKAYQLSFLVRDQRKHWHWAPDCVIDLYGSLLGHAALGVYYALCRFANGETQEARPTHKTLARVTDMSDRHVRRCLNRLGAMELIQIKAGGIDWASEYTLLDPPTDPERIAANLTSLSKARKKVIHKLSTEGGQDASFLRIVPKRDVQNVRPTRSVVDDIPITIDPQQQHTKSKNCASSSGGKEKKLILSALTNFGVSPDVVMKLLNREPPAPIVTLSAIEGWIEYASDASKGIRNPQGFVVDRLKKGAEPPRRKDARYRYIQGEYAEHIEH